MPELVVDEDREDTVASENPSPEPSSFGVDILHVIKDAQAQHGLRHGDYQRYHGYCNRRVKRLRKVLGFKMGEKKRVIPRVINESILSDSRYLLLIVMPTERAWSFAMKLKQEASSDTRKRHHMIQRLKKAAFLANSLSTLCDTCEKVDARTKLEAKAYAAYMDGIFSFECQDWTKAMELFNTVKTIYGKLCETMSKDDRAIYQQMIDDVSPNIRYCAYNIGDQTAMDDLLQLRASGKQDVLLADKLDFLVIQAKEQKAMTMGEVTWKKHHIPVKSNKIRIFLISLKAFDKEITMEKTREEELAMYDNILGECKDALQCARDDIAVDKNADGDSISDLDLLHSYLNYICVMKTISRNILLAKDLEAKAPSFSLAHRNVQSPKSRRPVNENAQKKVKHSDFIRLYDIILQNLLEIPALKGLSEDLDLTQAIYAQEQAFRALKCFYIAEAYGDVGKWKEAMALYEQVLSYSTKALDALNSMDGSSEENFVDVKQLEELTETIAFNKYHVHASAVMQASELKTKGSMDEDAGMMLSDECFLMDNLNEYISESNIQGLVSPANSKNADKSLKLTPRFPPSFEPVPNKPLFFDLALNHMSFPTLEDKISSKGKDGQGISGYIKSLWSWGGNKT